MKKISVAQKTYQSSFLNLSESVFQIFLQRYMQKENETSMNNKCCNENE